MSNSPGQAIDSTRLIEIRVARTILVEYGLDFIAIIGKNLSIEFVNTLEGGKPQYRLGDAVVLRNARSGREAFNIVVGSPELFTGTILHSYAKRIDAQNTDPQWKILKAVVNEKSREWQLETPRKDELVVHLRMGDRKGFKGSAKHFVDYIVDLARQIEVPLVQITIVTALHFGKMVLKETPEEEVHRATSQQIEKVEEIVRLLTEIGLVAKIYSHQHIDQDFCYLVNSSYLVLGNGHFSFCAAVVSNAQCFVPPWVKKSSPG